MPSLVDLMLASHWQTRVDRSKSYVYGAVAADGTLGTWCVKRAGVERWIERQWHPEKWTVQHINEPPSVG